MTIALRLMMIATLLLPCGCQGFAPDNFGGLAIWNEVKELPIGVVVGLWLRDVVVGVLLGLIIGLVVFYVLRSRGCYRITGWSRVWVLIAIGLMMAGGGGVIGGVIGNLQAGLDIAEVGLRDTAIGKKALPAVGELAAELLVLIEQSLLHEKNLVAEKPEGPRQRKEGIAVGKVVENLNHLQKGAAQKMASAVIDHALVQNPDWAGSSTEKVARWALPLVAEYLIDERLRREMVHFGIPDLLDELAAEAERRPDGVMSRAEIGDLVAKRILEPALMKPLRRAIRDAQVLFAIVAVLGALAPIALIEAIRWWRGSKQPEPPPTRNLP